MTNKTSSDLEPVRKLAAAFRARIIEMSHAARTAHLASSLSCTDLVAVLYHSVLALDSKDSRWEHRDRFILSKGHGASSLYVALAHSGYLTEADLQSFGREGSLLEEHPSPRLPGVEAATGSLGHGLSVGCGIALAAQIKQRKHHTFVLMSDGECNEGSVWEAAMFAAAKRLGNLCAMVDFNKWQATGRSVDVLALEPLADKFRSFGWLVHEIDGHDYGQIIEALTDARLERTQPTMIVAHTVKGKGVSFMEDNNDWHYRVPSVEEVRMAKTELGVL